MYNFEELNILWASAIEKPIFDILKKCIAINGMGQDSYSLVFNGVCGLCWVNGRDGKIYEHYEWDFCELTSIAIISESNIFQKGHKQFDDLRFQPNVIIEIWDTILLIEAFSLTLNGIEKKLK